MTISENRGAGHLWIVGPGRLGLALGEAMLERGAAGSLTFSGRAANPPAHPLLTDPRVAYQPLEGSAPTGIDGVLVTVSDREIQGVDATLAALEISRNLPVLHTSGALGGDALDRLRDRGHPTGSLHPLVSVPSAPDAYRRLLGAWFAVEGAPAAIALAAGIVRALEGRPLEITPEGKPLYHAAAVLASNYVTTLLSVSERLLHEAGVDPAQSRPAMAALATGAISSTLELGPERALTGPIARGDETTVRMHLSRLSAPDRELYSVLARHTLELASSAGLPAESRAALARALEEERT